jgi:hypothetical protein
VWPPRDGAFVYNAVHLFMKPRAAVTVRFGAPLPPPADANDSRALRTFTREIMQAISELAVGLEDASERVDEASGVETERTGLFD